MLNVLCFWFGALLAGLDSLILAAFAQMKLENPEQSANNKAKSRFHESIF